MAENNHINLTDDIEKDLLAQYGELCEKLTSELGKMSGDLLKICEKTQYEPMVNAVNDTINIFDDEISKIAHQAFEEWLEGDGSFEAAATNSRSGDAAEGTARGIQDKLKDAFEGFWSSRPLGDAVGTDTSRPKVNDEDFDELQGIYKKYSEAIEDIGESAIRQITAAGSDDPTYNVIIPAMKAIKEPMKEAFEKFGPKIVEAKEKSKELKDLQDSKNAEATEAATVTSAHAGDIAAALDMYGNI